MGVCCLRNKSKMKNIINIELEEMHYVEIRKSLNNSLINNLNIKKMKVK